MSRNIKTKIILLATILLLAIIFKSIKMSLSPEKIVDYNKACDSGSANECNKLALIYYSGLGVERDELKASDLYKKACYGGYTEGCYNLGFMYYNGIGIMQDDYKAVKFYTRACNEGHAVACSSLGVIYEKNEDSIIEVNNFPESIESVLNNDKTNILNAKFNKPRE